MWTSDLIQFARLITGLNAAGVFDDDVVAEMHGHEGLDADAVRALIERAEELWKETQQHSNPQAWIEEEFGPGALRSTLDDS